MNNVEIGSIVEWDSQANSSWKRKRGRVIAINANTSTADVSVFKIAETPLRGKRANFKEIKERLYKPRISALRKIKVL